jgi:hypothetical protein
MYFDLIWAFLFPDARYVHINPEIHLSLRFTYGPIQVYARMFIYVHPSCAMGGHVTSGNKVCLFTR